MRPSKNYAVFFNIKRTGWGWADIYHALKTGKKTSEWRDGTDHWISRLFKKKLKGRVKHWMSYPRTDGILDIPDRAWKHKKARFRVGYKLGPTLEADITAIVYHQETIQFEVKIENVVEIDG